MTRSVAVALLAAAGLLSACTEAPQTSSTRKADVSPSAGTAGSHTAAGWKAGDANSWDAQIKARTQGQNEYSRVSGS